jgi:hypothetical protein
MQNLESNFITDNKKNGRVICICGRKGSGKSYLATNYLAVSYLYNTYDEYVLIFPEFNSDNNDDTYDFIKTQRNTTVFTSFDPSIIDSVKEKSKTKKVLFILDDATGYLMQDKGQQQLCGLTTTCRHGKGVTVILICHALKSVLKPVVRGMIDYLMIGAFTNYTIIKKQLYEENLSMLMDEKDFIEDYKELIIAHDHNFLLIDGKCRIDFNVEDWQLSHFDRKQVQPNGKCTTGHFDEKKGFRERAKKTIAYSEIKREMTKPKKPEGGISFHFGKRK